MNPVQSAIKVLGGPSAAAEILGVSVQAVCFWRDGRRRFPIEHCSSVERATDGAVRRWDLRPDDWHRIWPELIGTPGAPSVEE